MYIFAKETDIFNDYPQSYHQDAGSVSQHLHRPCRGRPFGMMGHSSRVHVLRLFVNRGCSLHSYPRLPERRPHCGLFGGMIADNHYIFCRKTDMIQSGAIGHGYDAFAQEGWSGTMAKPTPHSLSVGISVKTGAAHAGRPDSIWRVCAMTGTSAFSCLYTTEALP